MFKIESCELTVKDGEMTADMKMGGTGYLKLFMGTGEEAAKASEDQMIPFEEDGVEAIILRFPVEALGQGTGLRCLQQEERKMV